MPVIASGGAGNARHVAEALEVAQAALLASILHEDPARLGIAPRRAADARSAAAAVTCAPAIVQDAATGRVLMLAWMDDEAERLTREKGEAWFWSRSRERAVAQGRDLGQHARRRRAARRLRRRCAARAGAPGRAGVSHGLASRASRPSCGARSRERALERPAGSYTTELLEAGIGACARKVGEEAVELSVAALDESDERVVEEAADLVYHLYVLLAARGLDVRRSRTSSPAARGRRVRPVSSGTRPDDRPSTRAPSPRARAPRGGRGT